MPALHGRTALVTGASRGIGAAIALRLAQDGADVALTYASSERHAMDVATGIEALGGKAVAIHADSADPAAITAAVQATADTFGGLDILVNNAGVVPLGPLKGITVADIDRALAVNVRAVLVAVQAAVGHMSEDGRIITIGSNVADRIPGPGGALYAASKSALTGMNRALAHELGPRGITAVVVQPGPTDTSGNPADGPHSAQTLARIPLGRYGRPADIADLVAYLAGPGGRQITGTTITVDGGMNA
jgi:NAD(P)-dependent dehydrogenase (short-subunit alcohol dehydrogenase family)